MSVRNAQRGYSGRGGFTLVEALIASAIVGIGLMAMLLASKSGTQVNASAREITHAINLGQEVREWTLKLPFLDPDTPDNPPGPDGSSPQTFVDDLDDLKSVTYSPPRDGTGQALSDMTGWSQQITLSWRNPDNLLETVADGASEMIYVEVVVSHEGQSVLTTGWLVTKRE
ncbi:MAG: prepilin-type N-terminal cleavage/methylation domain-containing protein [Phycisphaerae bacterium]|nr:prepilin-type N-terminal cleavage/methylation domain-containing protein [Phycisphaerae bacterium]